MTGDLLQKLRSEVERAAGLSDETREKLLGHVATMEQYANDEVVGKAKAQSVMKHLSSSIEELEASHPAITSIIGRIAVALGNMGI